jgi:SMC interacting uncharacterized protein involved in chromosome segregation
MSAWRKAAEGLEIAMAQKCASYEATLNAEIAKREELERQLSQAVRERDNGRKDLANMWDEKQKLFQEGMQIKFLNDGLQKRCAEFDTDKQALRLFINKLRFEKDTLAQDIQILREERNAEAPDFDELVERVKAAITNQYQENISNREFYISF